MASDLLTDEATATTPDRLPDRYEIIDGHIVEMPEMSAKSTVIGTRLTFFLSQYGFENNAGEAHPDTLFKLPLPVDRNRRPDVAFVPFSRWAKDRPVPDDNTWNVLPSLMVEVLSPNDLANEIMEKVREYFDAGATQVWVVYPHFQLVHVYESFTALKVLTRHDELTGEPFLPGFRLALDRLFLSSPSQPS